MVASRERACGPPGLAVGQFCLAQPAFHLGSQSGQRHDLIMPEADVTSRGMRVLVRLYLWHDLLVSTEGKREVITVLEQLLSKWAAGPTVEGLKRRISCVQRMYSSRCGRRAANESRLGSAR